jgi:hypothetical protein
VGSELEEQQQQEEAVVAVSAADRLLGRIEARLAALPLAGECAAQAVTIVTWVWCACAAEVTK